MNNTDELYDKIKILARSLGIVDIGIADAKLWNTDPLVSSRIKTTGRPESILPTAKSVIVIGIPIQRAIIETAPSISYANAYKNVNTMLDQITERISLELNILGYDSIYIPRDGYHGIEGLKDSPSAFFSHRHAAYLAGLGTFGMNNVILTKKYGPRIRFSSVITTAELPSDSPMTEELCIKCKKCTKVCPVSAVSDQMYPSKITKKELCIDFAAELAKKGISPCGACIRVCPVGLDRDSPIPTDEAKELIRSYVK